jgi:ATP-dependent Clp protease protease subunit
MRSRGMATRRRHAASRRPARTSRVGAACLLLLVAAALVVGVAGRSGPAAVDPEAWPARVTLTRAGLALEGAITPATLPGFALVLAAAVLLDTDGRTVLDLDSRGGNLDAALLMRRLVKAAEILIPVETSVGPGRSCQSACAVLFAAGASRAADPTALFMFHAPAFTGGSADPAMSIRTAVAAEGSYLAALAEADPDLVRALKARGVFDSTAPSYARAGDIVAGGWRFVTRLHPGTPGGGS